MDNTTNSTCNKVVDDLSTIVSPGIADDTRSALISALKHIDELAYDNMRAANPDASRDLLSSLDYVIHWLADE